MNDTPLQGYASEDNVRRSISEISFNTPRMPSSSRRSSGRATPASSAAPNTPPSYAEGHEESKQTNRISMNLSAMGAHNFTPSLHASLVSEILALRREVESKSLSIETLESGLQGAKAENDTLHEKVAKNARESRAVKKQLASIEDGTLSAIEGLCKERDEANEAKLVLQRRLEESQTKAKTLDAEAKRLNSVLANEKRHWDNERVSLMRRMTIAESRLKAVVKEFAGAQASTPPAVPDTPTAESPSKSNVKSDESDGKTSVRTLTRRGHGRGSSSVATTSGLKRSNTLSKGATLADEINFEDEYDEASDEEFSEGDLHRRTLSRSTTSSDKARKVLGMVTQIETRASQIRASIDGVPSVERSSSRNQNRPNRQDLSSPLSEPGAETVVEPAMAASPDGADSPATALQIDNATAVQDRATEGTAAASASLSQLTTSADVASAATQTDSEVPPHPTRPAPSAPASAAPLITIHNPEGEVRPRSPDLPADYRTAGCQTTFASWSKPSRSTGIQTEGIRIDGRVSKLPPHLLPSVLDELTTTSPISSNQSEREYRSVTDTPATSYEDVKTGLDPKDDEENVEEGSWARLKRAFRPTGSSRPSIDMQEAKDLQEVDISEDDLAMPPIPRAATRNSRNGRPAFDPPTPVPEDEKVGPNPVMASQPLRQTNFATVIQDGRSHSPSLGSAASSSNVSKVSGPRPPFAVPPRRSSKTRARRTWKRGVNISPTRNGRISPTSRAQFGQDPILRKVQSAAALDLGEPLSHRGAQSESPYSPMSPTYPPVPVNSAAYRHYRGRSSKSQPFLQSYNLAAPTANTSVSNSMQYTVVDAITATMIGEWMWKYVRKRKSFGVTENADSGKNADARHRRWVWLSPYERCIMWSSKQPTSNSALMGKPGRKLSIQSVLDVKDDAPLPKGADPETAYGRSILILTPSRALKFTAPTRERHYLWLNALSFLAHQSSTLDEDPDLHFASETMAPAPSPVESKLPSARDSIRGPLASMRTSIGRRSSRSSGQATPTLAPRDSLLHQHQRQDSDIPDAAFAPTVPRVPMHSRKRSATNPARIRPILGGLALPSPTGPGFSSNVSMLSAASSSVRGAHSYSGASSVRREASRGEAEKTIDFRRIHNIGEEATPRQSDASAEFGGNTNFFDAGGLVRMHAFVSPGVLASSAAGTKQGSMGLQSMHDKGDGSKDSFIGPPPIGRQQASKTRRLFGRRAVVGEASKRYQGFFSGDEA